MTWFNVILVFYLAIALIIQSWVLLRRAHIAATEHPGPGDIYVEQATGQTRTKIADFEVKTAYFNFASLVFTLGLLIIMTMGGGLAGLHLLLQESGVDPVFAGVIYVWTVLLIYYSLHIPFDLYEYWLAKKYQKSSYPPNYSFIKYQVVFLLKAFVLGTPLLWIVLWILQHAPGSWWLMGWLMVVFFLTFYYWIYPVFIAPLYHRLAPLTNEALRGKIMNLVDTHGLTVRDIKVLKNAETNPLKMLFFSGFGSGRILIINDRCLEASSSDNGMLALVCTAIALQKNQSQLKLFLLYCLSTLIIFMLLGLGVTQPWLLQSMQLPGIVPKYIEFVIIALLYPVLWALFHPLVSYLKHQLIFSADKFATRLIDEEEWATILGRLTHSHRPGTSDLLYSIVFCSDPSTKLRIDTLMKTH